MEVDRYDCHSSSKVHLSHVNKQVIVFFVVLSFLKCTSKHVQTCKIHDAYGDVCCFLNTNTNKYSIRATIYLFVKGYSPLCCAQIPWFDIVGLSKHAFGSQDKGLKVQIKRIKQCSLVKAKSMMHMEENMRNIEEKP